MHHGTITATGRDLDIAMRGDALLVVQAPNGEEAYPRRGDLMLSASGLLTTGDGSPVQGPQGPVTIPPADARRLSDHGGIWIGAPGGDPKRSAESRGGTGGV